MSGHEATPARRRSRLFWLPTPVRNAVSTRADRWATTRFGEIVRRQIDQGGASAAVTRLTTESFTALYQPGDQEMLPDPIVGQAIVDQFHKLYHASGATTWKNTRYRGVRVLKNPFDLWIYQELLDELRPELIIETGTFAGGSALYFADLCDLFGRGRVLSIDIDEQPNRPTHDRITYLRGSSTAPEIMEQVQAALPVDGPVLVLLDSDHSATHVRDELRLYAPLATVGSYVVVEDTTVDDVLPSYGPGPKVAVAEFLATTNEFEIDLEREKLLLTSNRMGYLLRVQAPSG
jgi:cephalosporin hydroxylase